MDAFVEMRRFLVSNAAIFERLNQVELKQLETDQKFEKVFNYIASQTEVKQNIFYDGQIYDAFSTLNLLCKKNTGVDVLLVTAGKG